MPFPDLTGGDSAIYVIETLTSWGDPISHAPVSRKSAVLDVAFYKECNIPVVAVHRFMYDKKVTF